MDVMDRWPVFMATWIVGVRVQGRPAGRPGLELDLLKDEGIEFDLLEDQG